MTFRLVFGLLLSVVAMRQGNAAEPGAFAQSTQMMVVTTPDWNAVQGTLQRYERATSHAKWHAIGDPTTIVVGTHGMGWGSGLMPPGLSGPTKKEGDGKSPAGVFAVGTAFGDAPRPLAGLKLPYLPLSSSIECVDDTGSKFYNRVVDRSTVAADWNSSEHMRAVGEPYHWGIVIDHNAKPTVSGAGSCIFLHIWSGPTRGTAGCTAMPQSQLETLLNWLDPDRKPLLVQLPAPEYTRSIKPWGLPLR